MNRKIKKGFSAISFQILKSQKQCHGHRGTTPIRCHNKLCDKQHIFPTKHFQRNVLTNVL